jgi:predicted RNA binding protein YcfA (HicA-like mRNA interferase family)
MGLTRYPLLRPKEVISVLIALGFSHKRTDGSHAQYERPASDGHERALVTVDLGYSQFTKRMMQNMIRQSKFSRTKFYGATKKTARRI